MESFSTGPFIKYTELVYKKDYINPARNAGSGASIGHVSDLFIEWGDDRENDVGTSAYFKAIPNSSYHTDCPKAKILTGWKRQQGGRP